MTESEEAAEPGDAADAGHWTGRRVLVTGAGGFVGSHLVEALVRAGAEVRAMVRYNGRSDVGSLRDVDAGVRDAAEIVFSDITDPFAVRRVVTGMDTVFHLAALIAIPYSYVAPASYVMTNVNGTLNVLEAVRDLGIRRMVQTSTSETYGTARSVPMDESHPMQAQSPYSASKIAADALAESFHRSFESPVATIRPFNTFGPRQSARAVIPTIGAQLVAGRTTIALGDARPVRDLTYVTDTVRAFLAVARTDACVGRVTNIGTGSGISIGELAHLMARVAGVDDLRIDEDPRRLRPEASEVLRLVADATEAKRLTGWEPRITLEQGLASTLDYIRAHPDRYEVDRYTT
jgi:NAD dependent epimerase/dehydratase